jgi:hypothetical protein
MGVFEEIQTFIESHKPCGRVTGTVDTPTAEGYSVSVRCVCGETLCRWVSAQAARHDLIYSTLLCHPN